MNFKKQWLEIAKEQLPVLTDRFVISRHDTRTSLGRQIALNLKVVKKFGTKEDYISYLSYIRSSPSKAILEFVPKL